MISLIFFLCISSFKLKLKSTSLFYQISSSFQIACSHKEKIQNNENDDSLGSNIRLPILQLFKPPGNLVGEFICGTEIINGNEELLQRKISSAIKMNFQTPSSSSSSSSSLLSLSSLSSSSSRFNLYSSEQIANYVSNKKCVILVTRQGCKQCEYFERHIFNNNFLKECQKDNYNFDILDVQTEFIEDYIEELKFRLTGKTISSSTTNDIDEDCFECNNTGLISCNTCHATGMVARGNYTTICMSCTGFKKVRCPSCGGKCVKCDM